MIRSGLTVHGFVGPCLFMVLGVIATTAWGFTGTVASKGVGAVVAQQPNRQSQGLQRRADENQPASPQRNPPDETLQRGSPAAPTNRNEAECQRRHADWRDSLGSRSLFWGLGLNALALTVFTILGFSNTWVRLFVSIVVAVVLVPAALTLQMVNAFKVCPSPPGFFTVLSADLFVWTLAGILLSVSVIAAVRYFGAIRTAFRRHLTS